MTEIAEQDQSKRPLSGIRGVIGPTLVVVAIGVLGLFLFSFLGRFFFLAELAGNFRCQILVILVTFGGILLLARRWWMFAIVGLATLASLNGVVSVYMAGSQPKAGTAKLKLMSYNIFIANHQFDVVLNQIRVADPDVVALLEYTFAWDEVVPDRLDDYPYRIREPRWHGFGLAIFSKHPLKNSQILPMTKTLTDNPWIVSDVQFNQQSIRIAAVHVASPIDPERLRLRDKQFVEIAAALSGSSLPTVVMGDFNCTPWSRTLVDFLETTGFRDSRQGFGYHGSFPATAWILRIPIDHAFVSPDIHVHGRSVGTDGGSDHLPIFLEVSTAGRRD